MSLGGTHAWAIKAALARAGLTYLAQLCAVHSRYAPRPLGKDLPYPGLDLFVRPHAPLGVVVHLWYT